MKRCLAGCMVMAGCLFLAGACHSQTFSPSYNGPDTDEIEVPVPAEGGDGVPNDVTSIYDLNFREDALDSHASDWKHATLELDRRSVVSLESPDLAAINALYPRIKRLADGTYLLIYQQGPQAHDIYYATSPDLKKWTKGEAQLFPKVNMDQFETGVSDRRLNSSADAIVLSNGDILAFASFRLNKGYRLDNRNNGLLMSRSTDNAKTWSVPMVIYRGTTWEPSALELSTGEIHVYFTSADPNLGDSGTGLLRSLDGGNTWTHVGKVIRERSGDAVDGSGVPIYTDQMPVAIRLNGTDDIAVVVESRFGGNYDLSMAWSSDNWSGGEPSDGSDCPADRVSRLWKNEAAPYIRQFPSGETVVSCNVGGVLTYRIGDARARTFGVPVATPFTRGYWGNIEVENAHTLLTAFPETWSVGSESHARIKIARFVLNHRVSAMRIDGAYADGDIAWMKVSDALFIGSEMQAQVAIRFAYDDTYLYCRVDRQDAKMTLLDAVDLLFVGPDGNIFKETAADDGSASGGGCVTISRIPREKVAIGADGRFVFDAILHDDEGDDTFTGLSASDPSGWIPVVLE